MKRTKDNQKYLDKYAVRWILLGLAGTTLYFQTNVADPFNSPKMWVIFLISSWLTGYVIRYRRVLYNSNELKKSTLLVSTFIIVMALASLATDVKYVALFGDTQRKNGFLTYLGLGIIFISATIFFRTYNITYLFSTTLWIAVITAVYGLMQTTGNDFINWVNSHNALIGTQGNPNFSSAVMAIMGVLMYSTLFLGTKSYQHKIITLIICLTLVFLILRSNARQGLLSFLIGVGFFQLIWIFGKNRKIGFAYTFIFLSLIVIGIFGMLQIGPLQKLLYKPSISVRGYYWRAGWEMLKDNPFTGIGIDRYGAYFMEYRDVGYPLNYGFEITSSNAHNTPLQFFATGGVFLGISYLLLLIFILIRAINGIRQLEGDNKILLTGLFSAWIAFNAQSLVSIDNPGVSIWGWVLAGSIIGMSVLKSAEINENRKIFQVRPNYIDLNRIFISGFTCFVAIIFVFMLFRGENNTFKSAGNYSKEDQAAIEIFRTAQLKVANSTLIDINYELRAAQILIQYGLTQDGLAILENVYKRDSRNLDALNFFALTYENYNQFEKAIPYREKIIELSPWNAPNYLQLGINYKKVGDNVRSSEMVRILRSFSTGVNGGPVLDQAIKELS